MSRSGARWKAGWVAGVLATVMPGSVVASDGSADARRLKPSYQAIDVSALVTTELFPTNFFGVDAAYVFGNETFQARAGAILTGARAFRVGAGRVANTMQAGQLDVCAAKGALRHRIRMCVGGQAGMMQHRWMGVQPGRKLTPYAAGTLRGDYRYAFTHRFGMLFGVGVSVPVVGPKFVIRDENGARPGMQILPGPIAGSMTLGASFAFI